MLIQFENLPSLDASLITSIDGIAIGSKNATSLVEAHPALFKIRSGRYGKVLTTSSNWGAPPVKLTYMDGTTEVTIIASDFATKTAGDRVWHPNERPR